MNYDKRIMEHFAEGIRTWSTAVNRPSGPTEADLRKTHDLFAWTGQFDRASDLPELTLCRLSVSNLRAGKILTVSPEDAKSMFENRRYLGSLARALPSDPSPRNGMSLRDAALSVVLMVEYTPLSCSWAVDMFHPGKLSGCYALSLIQHHRLAEAAAVLTPARTALGSDLDRGALMLAQIDMILLLEAQLWPDLLDAANRAQALTRALPVSSDNPQIAAGATEDMQYTAALCAAMTGMASASLGDVATARNSFTAAMASPYIAIAAWSAAQWGLAERTEGDNARADELFSKAQALQHSPRVTEYQKTPSLTLRVTSPDLIDRREDRWDPDTEPDPERENRVRLTERRATLGQEADALLHRQIGLHAVKAEMSRLIDNLGVDRIRRERGIITKAQNLNTVFYGSPGTGKTTTADAYTMHLAALGLVEDPVPLITSRSDYVGDKEGESSIKTRATIARARGKVLFIDEAYQIVQDRGAQGIDPFGDEAMTEIVALSEQLIGTTVFILAGYRDKMETLLKANAGLDSRFPRRMVFESYTPAEVAQIAVLIAADQGMVLDPDAADWLATSPEAAVISTMTTDMRPLIDTLGNGRFARTLVERAIEENGVRFARKMREGAAPETFTREVMASLTVEDVRTSFEELTAPHLTH